MHQLASAGVEEEKGEGLAGQDLQTDMGFFAPYCHFSSPNFCSIYSTIFVATVTHQKSGSEQSTNL